jgi:aspartate aminotransferase-like enzyme
MFKERLLTPGPTPIPQKVLQAMELPLLHHRSDVFKKELKKACEGVRWLLGWDSDPVFLACSGTGAMEASLLNTCKPGDEIIAVNGGVFGGRWGKIGERLGLTVREIAVEWGEGVTVDQVTTALRAYPNARCFCVQHAETSTCVLHDLTPVLLEVKRLAPHILTLVDGISSCATTAMPGDPSSLDIYIAGSQKALMLPPGLSIVALSKAAWQTVELTPKRSLYFDFSLERKSLATGETSWTPASTIIVGLNAALEIMATEKLENIYERHAVLSRMARAGLRALECQLVSTTAPSPAVTGIFAPEGIDADALRNEVRNRYGVRLAGGQGKLKSKIVRVGHMGHVDPFEVVAAVSALGRTLQRLGGSDKTLRAVEAMYAEMPV